MREGTAGIPPAGFWSYPMKTGLDLVALAKEITRRANAKKDFVCRADAIEMHVPYGLPAEGAGAGPQHLTFGEPVLSLGGQEAIGINKLAHKQIGEHADIPGRYYEKMKAEAPTLLAQNVNAWMQRDHSSRLVRTLDGNARAFLSDRYRPLENEELANAILPVLLDMDVEIMSSEITETRLYIKAVHRSIKKDIPAGRALGDGSHVFFRTQAPAIVISNSEVGAGALSVETAIFDNVCTNLAVASQRSLKKYHTGAKHAIAAEHLVHLLSDETRIATDRAVWMQAADVVRGAFDEARFSAIVDEVAGLQECKLEGNPVKIVELSAKRLGLNGGETQTVLQHLISGANLTALGLYNAVTRTAQDLECYDRASELERMGGKLIELPKHEWRELAKAA